MPFCAVKMNKLSRARRVCPIQSSLEQQICHSLKNYNDIKWEFSSLSLASLLLAVMPIVSIARVFDKIVAITSMGEKREEDEEPSTS